jgi:predicted dehydrogenase
LRAVASRSEANARSFAAAHGAEDPSVDAVYIATPNTVHREHALLCIDGGKPVLCEKPFTINAAEARDVVERARKKRVFCMEGMWMRFVPAARELERRVRAGDLGAVQMVNASLGYRFAFDATHRLYDPKLGGGVLLDLGVYAVSFALWILGRPVSISSEASFGTTGVDEQVSATMRFSGGQHATIAASFRARLQNEGVVMGSDGIIAAGPLYCPESLAVSRTPALPLPGASSSSSSQRPSLRGHPRLRALGGAVLERLGAARARSGSASPARASPTRPRRSLAASIRA